MSNERERMSDALERALPACTSAHCVTCADDADPMSVIAVDEERRLALCEAPDGRRATVEIALVSPVRCADRLLVHAGTAIAVVEEALG